jgi:hypothetical protein
MATHTRSEIILWALQEPSIHWTHTQSKNSLLERHMRFLECYRFEIGVILATRQRHSKSGQFWRRSQATELQVSFLIRVFPAHPRVNQSQQNIEMFFSTAGIFLLGQSMAIITRSENIIWALQEPSSIRWTHTVTVCVSDTPNPKIPYWKETCAFLKATSN